MYLTVEQETVLHAAYQTFGCPAAIAAASMAAELAEGKSLGEAASIREADIVEVLGGLPEGKEHCPRLAVQALRDAVGQVCGKGPALSGARMV
jgi:nitrogen fixation NifU-like protein